jgi:hypothetical protein
VQGGTLAPCCQLFTKLHGCPRCTMPLCFALWFRNTADFCTSPARLLGLHCRGGGAQAACLGVAHCLPALPAPSLASGSPTWDSAGSLGCSCYGWLCMPWSLGESTCGRVLLPALRIPRYVCNRGAQGPSLRSGLVFTFSPLCIDTCRVRAGMLWAPRILFFSSPASPHACLFGYLPLTMPLLRALNACISFLLLILLGCRQFCPVCLCSFCFASLCLTVLPVLVNAQLWSVVVSLVLFVLLHALLLFLTCVPLCNEQVSCEVTLSCVDQ